MTNIFKITRVEWIENIDHFREKYVKIKDLYDQLQKLNKTENEYIKNKIKIYDDLENEIYSVNIKL